MCTTTKITVSVNLVHLIMSFKRMLSLFAKNVKDAFA